MRRPAGLGRTARGAAVGLVGAALAVGVWLLGAFEAFEARTWDWRQQLLARPGPATDRVALILLDQDSLDWAREQSGLSWPWPREVYSFVVSFCDRAGARALAFDVLFLEPSGYGVYDDLALGAAVEESGRFVGSLFLGRESGDAVTWPPGLPDPQLDIQGLDAWLDRNDSARVVFPRASFPVLEIARNASAIANVQLAPDPDGVYRRTGLFQVFAGRAVPSLALAAYAVGRQQRPDLRIAQGGLVVDGYTVPVDASGEAILRFRGPSGTHRAYSAAAIIQSELRILEGEDPPVQPGELRGRYVLFGFSAPGLFDLRSSPVSGVYPGAEIHATALDNLLSGDFMRRVPAPLTAVLALVLALGAGAAASLVSGAGRNVLVYAAFLCVPPALGVLFFLGGLWLPLVALEASVLVTLTGSGVANYATEGKQKRYIKNAFQQYLSPAVIEELIAHPERLKLGGERRVLSIFFSDLQGFTGISEGLSPEELTALLNDYLSAMTDIIQEEGGTVDKYEGDAIIAFWNAPLSQEDHAARAVRAALRCQQTLARLRPEFSRRVGRDLYMRIGVNTGPAVVGNMGSHSRFDYTMLGDAVNLAARLERINKQFGTYTMISRDTLSQAGDGFPARELSRVAVVGRAQPVTVYEPLLPEEYRERGELLAVFAEGLRAYYAGAFDRAARLFERTAGSDPPAASYLERCRELMKRPPGSWDGVWVMTSK
jgi:adenylate cyclase